MFKAARNVNSIVFTGLFISIAFAGSTQAMQPCPSRAELLEDAQTIVEFRVKSLFIGDTRPRLLEDFPARTARVELEVKRVIRGDFQPKEVVAFSFIMPPGPTRELTLMAMLYGFGDDPGDTFEWEPSLEETEGGEKIYAFGRCTYYRFPDFVEEMSDTAGAFRKVDPRAQP
jgi:hypothetical protein